ncbi:MAG: sigma-70 family RNA polymerase sigma factor [Balneolaceae bacterium]
MSRVDYSELVEVIQAGNGRRADELLSELMPRLVDYLRIGMGAPTERAREAVQQALLNVVEKIHEEKINHHRTIFRYLIRACRNEYLHQTGYEQRFDHETEVGDVDVQPPGQLAALLSDERQKILESCLNELDDESRSLIDHFFAHPDTTTRETSKEFGLSEANVRTRKSRIIARLHDCYKRKSRDDRAR